jgi:hypothetical protein
MGGDKVRTVPGGCGGLSVTGEGGSTGLGQGGESGRPGEGKLPVRALPTPGGSQQYSRAGVDGEWVMLALPLWLGLAHNPCSQTVIWGRRTRRVPEYFGMGRDVAICSRPRFPSGRECAEESLF